MFNVFLVYAQGSGDIFNSDVAICFLIPLILMMILVEICNYHLNRKRAQQEQRRRNFKKLVNK